MAPAIRLAEQGFVVDSALARSFANDRAADQTVRRRGACSCPDGKPLARRHDVSCSRTLARTLRAIAERGRAAILHGRDRRAHRRRDAARRRHHHDGGSRALPARVARRRCASTYRGYTLLTMPPSSSGGVTITETLNILEGFDPPAAVRQRALRAPPRLGVSARVRRSQREARRSGVRARADRAADRQGVRGASCARRSARRRATPTSTRRRRRCARACRRRTTPSSTRTATRSRRRRR